MNFFLSDASSNAPQSREHCANQGNSEVLLHSWVSKKGNQSVIYVDSDSEQYEDEGEAGESSQSDKSALDGEDYGGSEAELTSSNADLMHHAEDHDHTNGQSAYEIDALRSDGKQSFNEHKDVETAEFRIDEVDVDDDDDDHQYEIIDSQSELLIKEDAMECDGSGQLQMPQPSASKSSPQTQMRQRKRLSNSHYHFLQQFCHQATVYPTKELVDRLAEYLKIDANQIVRYIAHRRSLPQVNEVRPSEAKQTETCNRILESFDTLMKNMKAQRTQADSLRSQKWSPKDSRLLLDIMAYYAHCGQLADSGILRKEETSNCCNPWTLVCRWFRYFGGSQAHWQSPDGMAEKVAWFRQDFYNQRSAIRQRFKSETGVTVDEQLMEQELKMLRFAQMKEGVLSNRQPATLDNLRNLYVASISPSAQEPDCDITQEPPLPVVDNQRKVSLAKRKTSISTTTTTTESGDSIISEKTPAFEGFAAHQQTNGHPESLVTRQYQHDKKRKRIIRKRSGRDSKNYPANERNQTDTQPSASPLAKRLRSKDDLIEQNFSLHRETEDLTRLQTSVQFVERLKFVDEFEFHRALELVEKSQNIFYCLSDSGRIRFLRICGLTIIEE
jgi:hypothetical protein